MMDKPRRLFDAIAWQLQRFPKPDMLNAKENGAWKNYSTQQVEETVNKLSAGLLQLGVERRRPLHPKAPIKLLSSATTAPSG